MNYDLCIIGAGWAGFNAALTAKELGLSVCLIDNGPLGGTCLNQGCIPTKALIQSAKVYSLAGKGAAFGIEGCLPKADFGRMQARKELIIAQLRQGMQSMLKGIDFKNARARLVSANEVALDHESITSRYILIATGSRPYQLDKIPFDHKKILSSGQLLQIKNIPASLLIIGGGVIGCEFAGLFQALGSHVTLAEKMPQLLPGLDSEAGRRLEGAFRKKGVDVLTGTDASTLDISAYELVLVAVGRQACIQGLGLENAGVSTEHGLISVDETLKTSTANIYACGDCASKLMLAHYASYQGRLAARNISRKSTPQKTDTSAIPNCVFSDPEIACVGISEEQARSTGRKIEINKIHFLANGMARILDETEGFIKIVSDSASGEVIGGLIIGPRASELIATLTLAVSNHLSAASIGETVFAHPTLSESLSQAIKFKP